MGKNKTQTSVQNAVETTEAILTLVGKSELVVTHTIPQTRKVDGKDIDHPLLSKAELSERRFTIKITNLENLNGGILEEIIAKQARIGFGIAQDLHANWSDMVGGETFEFDAVEYFSPAKNEKVNRKERQNKVLDYRKQVAEGKLTAEEALQRILDEKLI
jgi:hypothetical protein